MFPIEFSNHENESNHQSTTINNKNVNKKWYPQIRAISVPQKYVPHVLRRLKRHKYYSSDAGKLSVFHCTVFQSNIFYK